MTPDCGGEAVGCTGRRLVFCVTEPDELYEIRLSGGIGASRQSAGISPSSSLQLADLEDLSADPEKERIISFFAVKKSTP